MAKVVELVQFKINDNSKEAYFLGASLNFEKDFLKKQPGFISRNLIRTEDGVWGDMAVWENNDFAMHVNAAMEKNKAAGAYFSFINSSSIEMKHFTIIQ